MPFCCTFTQVFIQHFNTKTFKMKNSRQQLFTYYLFIFQFTHKKVQTVKLFLLARAQNTKVVIQMLYFLAQNTLYVQAHVHTTSKSRLHAILLIGQACLTNCQTNYRVISSKNDSFRQYGSQNDNCITYINISRDIFNACGGTDSCEFKDSWHMTS